MDYALIRYYAARSQHVSMSDVVRQIIQHQASREELDLSFETFVKEEVLPHEAPETVQAVERALADFAARLRGHHNAEA